MPYDVELLKSKIVPIVTGQEGVTVYLFGSYAAGTANVHSDVDLLVIADQPQTAGTLVRNLYKHLSDLPLDYDILGYSLPQIKEKAEQNLFFQTILKEGMVLYGSRI
jgi:predicted nucleotidyltransferase